MLLNVGCLVLPNDEEILKAFGGFGKLALQVMYILVLVWPKLCYYSLGFENGYMVWRFHRF